MHLYFIQRKKLKGCLAFLMIFTFCISKLYATNTISSPFNVYTKGFIENKGQFSTTAGTSADFVYFHISNGLTELFITEHGLSYVFLKPIENATKKHLASQQLDPNFEEEVFLSYTTERMDVILKGARILQENIIKENPYDKYNNYYLPHCPEGVMEVRRFQAIKIRDVYPGIDWEIFQQENGNIKYQFVVHPGADPNQIKLLYRGAGEIEVKNNNEIIIATSEVTLSEGKLLCYQDDEEVASSYTINKKMLPLYTDGTTPEVVTHAFPTQEVSVSIENYDVTKTLIIDPELKWTTLYSTDQINATERPVGIQNDSKGNIFVAGSIGGLFGSEYPLIQKDGAYFQNTYNGGSTPYITQFDENEKAIWSTYYSGNGNEYARDLSIDLNDNIYIAVRSDSKTIPGRDKGGYYKETAPISSLRWLTVILQFNYTGELIWATMYGKDDPADVADVNSITTDSKGNVYICGLTNDEELVIEDNSTYYIDTYGGGYRDGFITKFDAAGNIVWGTYYGGNGDDEVEGITVDLEDNIYIVGKSSSNNLDLLDNGTFYQTYQNDEDGFIIKFDEQGNMLWGTMYGGDSLDYLWDIKVDLSNNVYVSGYTFSDDLLMKDGGGYYDDVYSGAQDGIICKFSPNGTQLWSTYFGGDEPESIISNAISIDTLNNIYIAVYARSSNMPVIRDCILDYKRDYIGDAGQYDIYLARFSPETEQQWGTYFGGVGNELVNCTWIDPFENNYYLAGGFRKGWDQVLDPNTYQFVNPGNGAYFDNTFAWTGNSNGYREEMFVSKFKLDKIYEDTLTLCKEEPKVLYTLSPIPSSSFEWSTGETTSTITITPNENDTLFEVISNPCYVTTKWHINLYDSVPPIVVDSSGCQSDKIQLSAPSNASEILWHNGVEFPKINVLVQMDSSEYSVSYNAPEYACKHTTIFNIFVDSLCPPTDIFIPNAFSPGNDLNGIFYPLNLPSGSDYMMDIYNRFGSLIFSTTDTQTGYYWDGKSLNGKKLENDVFTYQIVINGTQYTGNVMLVN